MRLSGILSNDSAFGKACTAIGTVIVVNLMFVVTLIPVITAGAGLCAMYSCMLKLIKYKEINPFREFFDAFRENFKTATLGWLIVAAVAVFMYVDIRVCTQMGGIMHILVYALYLLAIMFTVIAAYMFPVMASFEGRLRDCIRNSIFFAGTSPLRTLGVLFVNIAPFVVTYLYVQLLPLWAFLWCTAGFACVALINSKIMLGKFEKYLEPEQEEESEHNEQDEKHILEDMKKLGM